MASNVDPSVIADDEPVDKADVREQLQTIKDEITALQNVTSVTRRMAYNDVDFDNL